MDAGAATFFLLDVVDAHRGQIVASNAEGGGAQFIITLPRRSPPAQALEGS